MWARVVEMMLGFWLIMSRFVFPYETGSLLTNDLVCGFIVIVLAGLSYWPKTFWAHFLLLPVALWLIVYAYTFGHPAPPTAQNQIVTGLLIAMFAIIPNGADELPDDWKRFYAGSGGGEQ
jgi:hypothetical protein